MFWFITFRIVEQEDFPNYFSKNKNIFWIIFDLLIFSISHGLTFVALLICLKNYEIYMLHFILNSYGDRGSSVASLMVAYALRKGTLELKCYGLLYLFCICVLASLVFQQIWIFLFFIFAHLISFTSFFLGVWEFQVLSLLIFGEEDDMLL